MSFTTHNNTLNVYRKTNTGTNVAPVYTFVLQHSVDCTKDQMNSSRVIRRDGDKILADHIIYIDYISDIKMRDILRVDDDEFTIYRIHNPNEKNHHLEIYCKLNERGYEIGDS